MRALGQLDDLRSRHKTKDYIQSQTKELMLFLSFNPSGAIIIISIGAIFYIKKLHKFIIHGFMNISDQRGFNGSR